MVRLSALMRLSICCWLPVMTERVSLRISRKYTVEESATIGTFASRASRIVEAGISLTKRPSLMPMPETLTLHRP